MSSLRALPTDIQPVPAVANVAERLRDSARSAPDQVAIIVPPDGRRPERQITFAELDDLADRIAVGLVRMGVRPGQRLALMVRPGIEFIALTFGMFRSGAVVILIDPGMGLRRVLGCLTEVEPDGFVALPAVHAIRVIRRKAFPNAKLNLCVGRNWFRDTTAYSDMLAALPRSVLSNGLSPLRGTIPAVNASDQAAIIFTSGGTGPPKGVVYEHGMFAAQVDLLRERFDVQPGEVDLPAFPLFALFNAAMRVTTVVPNINPTKPACVDPTRILDPIRRYGVTQSFGSPALWNRVGRYCESARIKIPHLRRAISAGAPVPPHVLARMTAAFDEPLADLHTPYGATEALPVASISASQLLGSVAEQTRRGAGTCVGTAFPGVDIKIIEISKAPISTIDFARELPTGEIGEIIVQSPSATREYFRRPRETGLAKIQDGERFWHRMGDVGYLDEGRRLWFCGRKAHVVETSQGRMFSVCCEAIFNEHPDVYRSALVGVGPAGSQRPVIVVEPEAERFPRGRKAARRLMEDLVELALSSSLTQSISTFLIHRSFPVDIRHNIKINRERLAQWASRRLG